MTINFKNIAFSMIAGGLLGFAIYTLTGSYLAAVVAGALLGIALRNVLPVVR